MGETNVDKGQPNFKERPNEGSSTISTESTKMRILQEFSPKRIVALHVRWPAICQRNVVPLSMDSLLQHFSPQPFWQFALPGSHHANVARFVRKTSIFSGRIHNQYSHHLPSCKLSDSILILHSNDLQWMICGSDIEWCWYVQYIFWIDIYIYTIWICQLLATFPVPTGSSWFYSFSCQERLGFRQSGQPGGDYQRRLHRRWLSRNPKKQQPLGRWLYMSDWVFNCFWCV